MIALSLIVIGATYILALPALMRLQRLDIGHFIAYLSPIVPHLLWWVVAAAGIGGQSLANIIEVVFVGFIVIITSYVCAFVVSKKISGGKLGRIFLGIILSGTIMLRIFMPTLPE
jgi:hypothetical protein